VTRQEYRIVAASTGLASKKPTHADSPTRWISTHEMNADASNKRVALDHTMERFKADIGCDGAPSDDQWRAVDGVANFLRVPRQVMESLAADLNPTLHLVPKSITLLIKHCNNGEDALKTIDDNLTATGMKQKLNEYEKLFVQGSAIVAAYLNPQIQKPTETAELARVTTIIRELLQRRYSEQIIVHPPGQQESADSLFAALFEQPQADGIPRDEVDECLSIGAVNANGFIDVLSWWSTRKTSLPGHYQMAIDFFGTPATSTQSERVNSAAGREYTSARQSLSHYVFIQTMCLRSWMDAGILTPPANRAQAAADAAAAARAEQDGANDLDATVELMEIEQDDWAEEVLDDCVVQQMKGEFENNGIDSEIDRSC
jgi:hAT family C-terminal dimerisation region